MVVGCGSLKIKIRELIAGDCIPDNVYPLSREKEKEMKEKLVMVAIKYAALGDMYNNICVIIAINNWYTSLRGACGDSDWRNMTQFFYILIEEENQNSTFFHYLIVGLNYR